MIKRPMIIGEALFDEFDDGNVTLGGAPFNVAWHLQGFALNPVFVTRIGNDPLGDSILQSMQTWGMDTAGVQRDSVYPTGRVKVHLDNGQPSFSIIDNQAYDFIASDAIVALSVWQEKAISRFYHGSLIARNSTSRTSLQLLRDLDNSPVFVDINLRAPWWQHAVLESFLPDVQHIKLNGDELALLVGWAIKSDADLAQATAFIRQKYQAQLVIVTLGARGVYLMSENATHMLTAPVVTALKDTVGAGDAFSAVMMLGLHLEWSLLSMAERALDFAAAICCIHGAVAKEREFYANFLAKWNA